MNSALQVGEQIVKDALDAFRHPQTGGATWKASWPHSKVTGICGCSWRAAGPARWNRRSKGRILEDSKSVKHSG
jgi:hypothetical protein